MSSKSSSSYQLNLSTQVSRGALSRSTSRWSRNSCCSFTLPRLLSSSPTRSPVADFQRGGAIAGLAGTSGQPPAPVGRRARGGAPRPGGSPMRSPPVEGGDSLAIFCGDIPSNRLRASPRRPHWRSKNRSGDTRSAKS
uniref:Uncharacterized protein n=1 Tax=Oryza nivara TaxID=4536 RepID=A0A0E0IZD4_ORYNI